MVYSFEKEIENKYKAQLKEKVNQEELDRALIALKNVLNTSDGRKVMNKILSICPCDVLNNCDNPIKMSYNEGVRAVGIVIKDLIIRATDRKMYYQVLEETI